MKILYHLVLPLCGESRTMGLFMELFRDSDMLFSVVVLFLVVANDS